MYMQQRVMALGPWCFIFLKPLWDVWGILEAWAVHVGSVSGGVCTHTWTAVGRVVCSRGVHCPRQEETPFVYTIPAYRVLTVILLLEGA